MRSATHAQIIQLPQDFIDYLLSDGVYAPEAADSVTYWQADVDSDPEERLKWEEEADGEGQNAEHKSDSSSSNVDKQTVASFPDIERLVNAAVERLGGEVFPKLNWYARLVCGKSLDGDNAVDCARDKP
eukprot:scaffold3970_cov417-Prasinococcus_capsulatus_cf.AAC.6